MVVVDRNGNRIGILNIDYSEEDECIDIRVIFDTEDIVQITYKPSERLNMHISALLGSIEYEGECTYLSQYPLGMIGKK